MGTYLGSMEERVVRGTYLDAISWIFGIDFVKCLESGKALFIGACFRISILITFSIEMFTSLCLPLTFC